MKKSMTGNNANHTGIKLLIFIVYILVLINYSHSADLPCVPPVPPSNSGESTRDISQGLIEQSVEGHVLTDYSRRFALTSSIRFGLPACAEEPPHPEHSGLRSVASAGKPIRAISYPESEFIIEITIRKGSIKGMGRFEQKLPAGFFAIPVETHGGKFTFKNQKIKIVWMRMPEQNSFKISYRIKVYKDFSEVLFIGCKFQCVINKKKKNFTANKRISSIPQSAVALNINTRGGSGSGSGSGKRSKSGGGKLIEMKVQNVKGMFGKECYPDRGKSKHNKM
ncbi:MAG: hypothetical protein IIA88_07045 [Bacteroidetes bacterium]|nr:hypothetical protein [Bacteroidota bacterium]